MLQRPWFIVVLAALHILAPIGNLFFNAVWLGKDPMKYFFTALQGPNLVMIWPSLVLPIIAGVAIYRCKKSSFYIFFLCMLGLFIYSLQNYQDRMDTAALVQIILAFTLNIGIVTYFMVPAVREIYFNERLRWWEREDRYLLDLPCQITAVDKTSSGIISNISSSGLFLVSKFQPVADSTLRVEFKFHGEPQILTGLVVFHGKSSGGFGLRFERTPEDKKIIKTIIARLKSEGHLLKSQSLVDEGSFLNWLRDLATSGKGLWPKIKK
jgi:hypothetical protein